MKILPVCGAALLFTAAICFSGHAIAPPTALSAALARAKKSGTTPSPYGMHETIDRTGSHWTQLTRDDYVNSLVELQGMSRDEAENQYPTCYAASNFECRTPDHCKMCHMEYVGGNLQCTCTQN